MQNDCFWNTLLNICNMNYGLKNINLANTYSWSVMYIINVWDSLNSLSFKYRNLKCTDKRRDLYIHTESNERTRWVHWILSLFWGTSRAGALINQTEMSQFCCGWTMWPQTCQPLHLGQHVWTHIFSTSSFFVSAINGIFLSLKKKKESIILCVNVLYSLPSEPLFGIHLSCPFTWPGQQARGINGPVLSMSPLTDSHPLHWVWLDKWRNGSSTAHSSVYWDRQGRSCWNEMTSRWRSNIRPFCPELLFALVCYFCQSSL